MLNIQDQNDPKDRKWGFWLFMMRFLCLDYLVRDLVKRIQHTPEVTLGQHVIAFVISISLAYGINYTLRHQPWKVKLWVSWLIFGIFVAGKILISVL